MYIWSNIIINHHCDQMQTSQLMHNNCDSFPLSTFSRQKQEGWGSLSPQTHIRGAWGRGGERRRVIWPFRWKLQPPAIPAVQRRLVWWGVQPPQTTRTQKTELCLPNLPPQTWAAQRAHVWRLWRWLLHREGGHQPQLDAGWSHRTDPSDSDRHSQTAGWATRQQRPSVIYRQWADQPLCHCASCTWKWRRHARRSSFCRCCHQSHHTAGSVCQTS